MLDPHGDLVETILENIPKARVDDVVLFNPSDLSLSNVLHVEARFSHWTFSCAPRSTFKKLGRTLPSLSSGVGVIPHK